MVFPAWRDRQALSLDVPALVVSALDDRESVQRAMKAGASGFVSKASPSNTLIEAVRTVLAGGVFHPEAATGSDGGNRSRRASQAFAERFQFPPRPRPGARTGGPGQVEPRHRRIPRPVGRHREGARLGDPAGAGVTSRAQAC